MNEAAEVGLVLMSFLAAVVICVGIMYWTIRIRPANEAGLWVMVATVVAAAILGTQHNYAGFFIGFGFGVGALLASVIYASYPTLAIMSFRLRDR